MNIKEKWENLKLVYNKKESWLISIVGSVLFIIILFHFTNLALIRGNMGTKYMWTLTITQICMGLLLGLNLSLLWYKLKYSQCVDHRANGTTAVGSLLGVIVTGCPACGITLASYLGLASVFSTLPFFGLELKFLGIGLLGYSTNYLLKKLKWCEYHQK